MIYQWEKSDPSAIALTRGDGVLKAQAIRSGMAGMPASPTMGKVSGTCFFRA
jgi:hypothetical protein